MSVLLPGSVAERAKAALRAANRQVRSAGAILVAAADGYPRRRLGAEARISANSRRPLAAEWNAATAAIAMARLLR